MSSALDIINQATMLTGMRASGEVLDADLAKDCLTILNQLIDSWALEKLIVYTTTRVVVPLVVSQQTYTIGPGGAINTVRPVRIDDVNWRDESQVPPLELPVHKMTE